MLATVHPEHDKKARRTAIEFQSIESAPPLQQLPLALPLGPQLAILIAVLGLQSLEPHALPGVARAPRYETVQHRKIGGVSRPPPRSILSRLECDEPGPLLLNRPFACTNWRRIDRPKRAASESTSGGYCRREDKHGGYNYLRAPVWYCRRGFCLTVSPGTAEGAGIECQGRYYDGFTHRGRAATEPGR
jgi:hypothetical protein